MSVAIGALPCTIGEYRLDSLIGQGGMSRVYRAHYSRLGRVVALKTLLTVDAPLVDRLLLEAKAIASLNHPGIVTIYDYFDVDGQPFISMELLEGESLEKAMARGALALERRLRILSSILEALDYAHSRGVVHRDVKPSNVHLLPNGTVKLLDFGLAHVAREKSLTLSGTVMGTPHYMSPEQLKAEKVDPRTDVYSAGVVGYEMLTHRKPFPGANFTAVMLKALHDPTPAMSTRWSDQFPELEQIVGRAMAKSADERYASAAEMRDALGGFLSRSIDAVRRAAVDDAQVSDTAEQQARTLIAEGRRSDAEQLLDTVLSSNPGAYRLREILETELRPEAPVRGADEPAAESGRGAKHDPRPWPRLAAVAAIAMVVIAAVWVVWSAFEAASPLAGAGQTARAPRVEAPPPAPSSRATTVSTEPAEAEPPVVQSPPTPTPARQKRAGTGDAVATGGVADKDAARNTPKRDETGSPEPRRSANTLFYNRSGTGQSAKQPGLHYRVLKVSGEGEEEVDPNTVFRSGDRIRLSFESNVEGHLYIVQQGASGRWSLLFPHPNINGGQNGVAAFRQYMVPSGENAFRFDHNAGTERLFIVFSRNEVPGWPTVIPPGGVVQPIQQAVVENARNTLRPRDLVVERVTDPASPGRAGNFAVNNDAGGEALTLSLELVHK